MFEKLSDNLNLLMANARINASELARRTGLPASTIKKIRNRNNPNPTLTTLIPLAKCFSISVSQLVGEEIMPIDNINESKIEISNFQIPLLTWKEVITWPNVNIEKRYSFLTVAAKTNQNMYALTIEDNEWDEFPKDSTLIIDTSVKIEHRDFAVVHKDGAESSTLRQILFDEKNIYLKPVISGYNITPFTSQHRFIGVVIEYRKQLKKS